MIKSYNAAFILHKIHIYIIYKLVNSDQKMYITKVSAYHALFEVDINLHIMLHVQESSIES